MLLSICLTFCQFQSCVAYKSVAFKKTVYVSIFSWYLKKRNRNFMIWLTPQAQVVWVYSHKDFVRTLLATHELFSLHLLSIFSFWLMKTNILKQSLQYFFQYQCLSWSKSQGEECLFNILPNIIYIYMYIYIYISIHIYIYIYIQ